MLFRRYFALVRSVNICLHTLAFHCRLYLIKLTNMMFDFPSVNIARSLNLGDEVVSSIILVFSSLFTCFLYYLSILLKI